ncbi:MAG: hypothetical protein ACRDZ3_10045, partial [Acidimicrobiia bacterium]
MTRQTVDGNRIRTDRYGQGMRWRVRYLDPDGHHRSKMFARKVDAERFLASVTTDMLRGAYVDPSAGKVTFADFAARWLESRTFGESSREATEVRLRVHAYPHLGRRQLRDLRPSVIQAWVRSLQEQLAPSYVRVIFANVSAVLDRPKGGKTRTVPLPTSVAEALATHLQQYPAQSEGLVFTSREDKPINRSHFDPYIWHRTLAAVGVERSRQNGMHA